MAPLDWTRIYKYKQKHLYIFVAAVNLLLLGFLIYFRSMQYIMYWGGYFFFVFAFYFAVLLKPAKLLSVFLLSFIPFFIIGYIHHTQVYFDGIFANSIWPFLTGFLYFSIAFVVGFSLGYSAQRFFSNTNGRKRILISLTAFLLMFLSGSVNWPFQLSATGIIYFIAGILLTDEKPKGKFFHFFALISLPTLFIGIPAFVNGSHHIYPILIMPILGSMVGVLCKELYRRKKNIALVFTGTVFIIFSIMAYWGMLNYLQFIWGLDDNKDIPELQFDAFNAYDNSFTVKDISGKTAVIYFHTKTCAVCYRKLPELESLYREFKQDTNTLVLAIFVRNSIIDDIDTAYILKHNRKFNYSYPQYFSRESSYILEKRFHITGYPHSLIISKKGEIIHSGSFNNDPLILVDNARMIVMSDQY